MTIEELCKALGRHVNEGEELEYDNLVAIEKLLRAGQEMRKVAGRASVLLEDGGLYVTALRLEKATHAWDDATKGED